MNKIEILGKKIGEIYVKECLGGKPLRYLCVCPCGDAFTATSQTIRKGNIDCGCGTVTGMRRKLLKIGDEQKGSKILKVFHKHGYSQTWYSYVCAKCGKPDERTHSRFLENPFCYDCIVKASRGERDRQAEEEVVGKEVNGIKVLRLSKRDIFLYVIALCPVCGREFETRLPRIKQGIGCCGECRKNSLQAGHQIAKDSAVEGTSVLCIKPDRAVNKNNTTGHKGVSQCKNGRYRSYINFKRKQYHLGLYDTIEQAVEAREIAEKKIYGDFLEWYKNEYPEQWKKICKE